MFSYVKTRELRGETKRRVIFGQWGAWDMHGADSLGTLWVWVPFTLELSVGLPGPTRHVHALEMHICDSQEVFGDVCKAVSALWEDSRNTLTLQICNQRCRIAINGVGFPSPPEPSVGLPGPTRPVPALDMNLR